MRLVRCVMVVLILLGTMVSLIVAQKIAILDQSVFIPRTGMSCANADINLSTAKNEVILITLFLWSYDYRIF